MPTEAQIFSMLIENWKAITSGVVAAIIYIRLHRYTERLEKLEKRTSRLMRCCADLNPDISRKIYDD